MNDTVMTVIAIFLAAILMFMFPLMSTADRSDDIAQQAVQTATTEFVDDIRTNMTHFFKQFHQQEIHLMLKCKLKY